jgi:hypothetical protein
MDNVLQMNLITIKTQNKAAINRVYTAAVGDSTA